MKSTTERLQALEKDIYRLIADYFPEAYGTHVKTELTEDYPVITTYSGRKVPYVRVPPTFIFEINTKFNTDEVAINNDEN